MFLIDPEYMPMLRMIKRVNEILSKITTPPSYPIFLGNDKTRVYLQIKSETKCNVTGNPIAWTGRKWYLSLHMTDGEIVQTALKACLTAAEHEIREQFKYKGQAIFDPHWDIEKLVELRSQDGAIKGRTNE